ncbi:hypothetical protein LDENG_00231290 [Lucifuga dentata]|nr:hypothetical protein LDENG_00231290 [Lucifuga dentata]
MFLPGIHFMYALGAIILILAIIGVYGACKEKKWALIMFTVGMMLSSLIMFAFAMRVLAVRPMITDSVRTEYLASMPLYNASSSIISGLDEIQFDFQCCGLQQGYQDWGYNISASCLCEEESRNPCVAAPKNSSLFEHKEDDQPIMIYSEPCIPYLVSHFIFSVNCGIAVLLGLTLFWMLTVALCIAILCQLRRKVDVPPVVYSPEAKAGNYTILTDNADCA